ncbi:MAG: hypothetical protein KatS3mg002_0298 [Candidatus Woesearchaeota archaeon]|nr:MAG: hypothetical protein KatS3mg002_0298 [Candidatus Woesearchaeota archaeon]
MNKELLIELSFNLPKRLDLEKEIHVLEKKILTMRKFLKENKIDPKVIEKKAKITAKQVAKLIKKNMESGNSKAVGKQATEIFRKAIDEVKEKILIDKESLEGAKPILFSVILFFKVIFFSTIIMILGTMFIGTAIANIFGLTAATIFVQIFSIVLVGPLVEEWAKRVATKNNIPWLYTSIFAATEMVLYLLRMPFTLESILTRLAVLVFHLLTVFLHKMDVDVKEKKNQVIEVLVKGKTGFILAVIVHMLWNGMALYFFN